MKNGPFHEHSRYLYDISGVAEWGKVRETVVSMKRSRKPQVNSGLIKMYKEEVLHKFPVIQHFLFGSLLQMDTQAGVGPAPTHAGGEMMTTAHPATWGRGARPL